MTATATQVMAVMRHVLVCGNGALKDSEACDDVANQR